ncbi:MAG TPA: fused MFS/spermidine synthase [Ktedonobacteraceae bacterium]|nr:fused MFS/spermidine synthase [Ktedonobacteraceae bacterium]
MSTTTPDPKTSQAENAAAPAASRRTLQGWLLVILVFVAGAASLAVEMAASRLLAPYFGTSLFVWANVIGLILLYLTVGYYVGGRLADRVPKAWGLYLITTIAAFSIGLIPFISRPILSWSLSSFSTYSISVFYGSLVSVILLFALPIILLGCVSPYAIRLSVNQVGSSGRTAGMLYAISTAGSMLGTFIPVLWLIPTVGTYRTFLITSATLLLVSVIGLVVSGRHNRRSTGFNKNFLFFLLFVPLSLTLLGLRGPIKPADGTNGGGRLIAERESAYNYMQVVQANQETQLILNEGVGIHSIYSPSRVLTGGPWDYFLAAPYFNNYPYTPDRLKSVCVIGLGAGTIPNELTQVYGNIPIDGVEIDPEIVTMGRTYFHMNEPNLHVIVQDGRYYLRTTPKKYDMVAIDAYQQPYVPFQLATSEFFGEVRSHLTPQGVAVINAGRTGSDFRLVEALAQTMRSVFPNVYIINTQRFANSLIIATNDHTSIDNFTKNIAPLTNPYLQDIGQISIATGDIRQETHAQVYFSDDKAPVEQLIDQIIFDYVTKPGK